MLDAAFGALFSLVVSTGGPVLFLRMGATDGAWASVVLYGNTSSLRPGEGADTPQRKPNNPPAHYRAWRSPVF